MKHFTKLLACLGIVSVAMMSSAGCGGACADLDKKKADCASNKEEAAKKACEQIIDAAVKAANEDACKAANDALNKK